MVTRTHTHSPYSPYLIACCLNYETFSFFVICAACVTSFCRPLNRRKKSSGSTWRRAVSLTPSPRSAPLALQPRTSSPLNHFNTCHPVLTAFPPPTPSRTLCSYLSIISGAGCAVRGTRKACKRSGLHQAGASLALLLLQREPPISLFV